ncbi:hypothetical protein RhiirB3_387788 [Rhizophagus irregularis]|nr:hypothetical protein RhiirB3_387788 [Rhizophagus irregularis]
MVSNTNNKSQVDYLKVKQLINNLRDSSFLEFLKVDLREYNADDINETHIVNTVKLTSDEDLTPYKALFSEFQDVFSIFEKYTTVTMSVNLNEMAIDLWNDGDWKWYYTPNLKQKRNCYQKVKQDDDSEVSQKNTNTFKSDKKHKKTKQAKKIDKSLDSIDKFMVLADIRSMLRKLEVS